MTLAPRDAEIAMAIIAAAQKQSADRDKWMADYIANRTAGLTSRWITGWLGRQFRAMTGG